MTDERYPEETTSDWEDNGTMTGNVQTLREAVVGSKIVSAERKVAENKHDYWTTSGDAFVLTLDSDALVLTLDSGRQVILRDTSDCCAFTELQEFLLDPAAVDHVILGVGTTDGYETWHIYADYGDVLKLNVGWSCGNPFYYGYGFDIQVEDTQ